MKIKARIDALRKGGNEAPTPPVDANGVILGSYLEGYTPVDSFGPGVTVKTTDDIIAALAEMADISQADVNQFMAMQGFTPGRNTAGSFGWLMKRTDTDCN